ncbi:MAG: hypothetical protein EHM47_03530 [Ignavibacteriales bacterium]|nr:MAG: hypothetical protein EHM47_03530 [Ignavibacteriales bacterium]
MFFNKWNASLPGLLQSYIIILIFTVLIIFFYAGLFTQVTKRFGVKTLVKDNFSLIIFSFLPYTFSLIFLFTLEMVIFGETLFYYDPSPFILKGTIAYIFLTFECLMILWSFFLSFTAFKVQSKSNIYSVIFSILIHVSIYIILYYISAVIYL